MFGSFVKGKLVKEISCGENFHAGYFIRCKAINTLRK